MSLDATLSLIETQLQDIESALLATDPVTLEPAATQLRQAAVFLLETVNQARHAGAGLTADQTQRTQTIASRLHMLREQLQRLLALTERQVATILPSLESVTYGEAGNSVGTSGARLYRSTSRPTH